MKKIILPAVLSLFCLPALAQTTPNLQSVTTNGNSTTQWLQITGANGVLSTGAGLELFGSSATNTGYVKAYNRVSGTPGILKLQDTGGNTHINENGGLVGIGTSSPLDALHISTAAGAGGITVQSRFALSAGSGAFLRMYNSGMPTAVNQRLGGILFGTSPAGATLRTGAQIDALSEGAWTDGSSQPTYLRFMTTKAGASAPTEHVRITSDGNINIQLATQFGMGLTDNFTYDNKIQPHYGMQWIMDSWSTAGATLWASAYGGMKFITQRIPRLTITGGGNVGIGTEDTKGYKFAVNGDAMFAKIKVKTYATWPDYVFGDDYQLPALPELTNYIMQHKHLPEIPAAAEVEKDGMDVAEMNRLLLKKVEELTLYIIDQHKQLDDQQAAAKKRDEVLAKLQQEIAELKKQSH